MSNEDQMEKRIKEVHKPTWEKYAGIGSVTSLVLPILNEFESVGSEIMMGVGGAVLVSVFIVILKIGNITSAVQGLHEEQDEHDQEDLKKERKRIKKERKRKKHSKYCNDPIGWSEEEQKETEENLNDSQLC